MSNNEPIDRIRKKRREWEEGPLKEALGKQGEREAAFTTISNIPLQRLYTPADLQDRDFDYLDSLGFPGEWPYTRGIDPLMYRGRLWARSQYCGYGMAEDSNQRIKYLLEQGGTGFYVALDLPTQCGYDSDHVLAEGEVGRVGVAIDSLEDMEILLRGVPLDKVDEIRTTAMAIGPLMLALFIGAIERLGYSCEDVSVKIQNDVLKEYVARGTQIFSPRRGLEWAVDTIEYCAKAIPNWSPISIAGGHMRSAGATVVQELAFTLSNAIAYLETATARGLGVDDFASQIEFLINANTVDLFEEVAKLRATRRLWASILRERFNAQNPESLKTRLNSFTSGGPLTAQEPLNNIVRITIQTLALALAGSQYLSLASYDEPVSIPSQEAAKIALRTSQIIAYETGVASVADPLGGSYYVESLTCEIEKMVRLLMEEIESKGGSVAAIENGYYRDEIFREAYNYQKDVETGKRVVVGVNMFRTEDYPSFEAFKIDPSTEDKQLKRLRDLKSRRDNNAVRSALVNLENAASSSKNTVPALIDAVKAYATVGEICDTLRQVWQ